MSGAGQSVVDSIAQAIRVGDGSHSMGAGAIAELVVEHLRSLPVEKRMEAMGMRPMYHSTQHDKVTPYAWMEDTDA